LQKAGGLVSVRVREVQTSTLVVAVCIQFENSPTHDNNKTGKALTPIHLDGAGTTTQQPLCVHDYGNLLQKLFPCCLQMLPVGAVHIFRECCVLAQTFPQVSIIAVANNMSDLVLYC